MHLGYQLWKMGCEGGAMTYLTALLTSEHVCVASGQLLLSLQYINSLVIQAPYLHAVAAILIHGISGDWSTVRPTALPFANRSKRAIVTVSGIACSDRRPRHYRFVCHSHLLIHLVINFRVSIVHWQI
jgi:hypothetical protein